MTFNGQNIGDSQVCIDLIADKFNLNIYPENESDKAISKAFQSMIEDRSINFLALERFAFSKFEEFQDLNSNIFPKFVRFMGGFIWGRIGKGMRKVSPFGKLSKEKLADKSFEILNSLSKFLDNKKFFFGDTMTLLDIVVFSYLTQIYFMSPDSSLIKKQAETIENLKEHHSMIKEMVYPDWDDLLYKD